MKTYNIYINGRFLSQKITGVQRYALELIRSIDKILDVDSNKCNCSKFTLLVPHNAKNIPIFNHISIKQVGRLTGHLWEQFELPYFVRNGFLVNFCNTAPVIKKNQIVTIHDVSVYGFPQAYSTVFKAWYRLLHKTNTVRSRQILTDSNYSKTELCKFCNISPYKVDVVSLGHEHIKRIESDTSIIERCELLGKPFV